MARFRPPAGAIILTGFMGTGKSQVGRLLAQRWGLKFLETDALIEEQEGTSIAQIFATQGEPYFRDRETAVLRQVLGQEALVLSTGGGMLLRPENVELLRAAGPIICLQASAETILERITGTDQRPLLNTPDPLAEIKRHLLDFIGTHTWEELCREWLLRASGHGDLPFVPDQVGSAWTRKAQVDVVGINTMEKTLILGECKWSPRAMGRSVLHDLVSKTGEIVPRRGNWAVYYLGFARGGWTKAAAAFANEQTKAGTNWHIEGMRLLDLEQVDADLTRWTVSGEDG